MLKLVSDFESFLFSKLMYNFLFGLVYSCRVGIRCLEVFLKGFVVREIVVRLKIDVAI